MKFYKDKIWYSTLLSILMKSIVFIGFTVDKTHYSFNLTAAFKKALPCIYYYVSFIVIFISFAFLFKNRARVWYLIIVNLLASVLILTDLLYYRGFDTMPSLHLLQQTANLDNLSDSIFSLLHWIDSIFFIDIIILIVFLLRKKELYKNAERAITASVVMLLVSIGVIAYIPVKVDVLKFKDPAIYYFRLYDPNITVRNLSPIGYHIFNAYAFWKDSQPYKMTSAEADEVSSWFEEKKEFISDNKYKGMFIGKNLIFIQLESFERFVLKQKIFGQEVTPNLNKMLEHSLYFPNTYEQVNQGQSSDGDLIANTSVYPLRQGSTFFSYPYTVYNSLPNLLKGIGYYTIALHPDKGSYWNWMPALDSMGFDKCVDSSGFVIDEKIGMGLSDGSFLKQVESILAKQKQPFYSFMVTLSSHAPFDLPEKYWELKLNEELDKSTLGGYFQSARYVDTQIGFFLDRLRQDNLLDNSVIVIYGDHCGVHKFYPKDVQKISNPEKWWLENNGQIPFIVYQNNFQGEEIKTIGGQIDILPTVAYLMGVDEEKYQYTSMGRNLLKTNRSFVVLKNRKFIYDPGSEQFKESAVKGLDLADIIIKSNYFKKYIKN
ncbi:MAG: LTA synthase family protein [Clostridia bacterium]|nr:LTA synthase family protein [Clostridia bacterium]